MYIYLGCWMFRVGLQKMFICTKDNIPNTKHRYQNKIAIFTLKFNLEICLGYALQKAIALAKKSRVDTYFDDVTRITNDFQIVFENVIRFSI